jgi:hypothetical protein
MAFNSVQSPEILQKGKGQILRASRRYANDPLNKSIGDIVDDVTKQTLLSS